MITVNKDGSGDFKFIQQAIDSIPKENKEEVKIFIKNGVYKEKLNIITQIEDNMLVKNNTRIMVSDHLPIEFSVMEV